jgi:CHAD domain-containing protein
MALDIDRIQKSVRRVRKFVAKAPKNPTPEKVHDLRTSARRLEATVEALGLGSKRREKRLLRDLAEVRKRAGKVRDMDVFTGHLLDLPPQHDEKECLIELTEHLGIRRAKAAKKLRRTAKELEPRLEAELKKGSKYFQKLLGRPQRKDSDGPAAEAGSEAVARALELSSELRSPARLDKRNLHPYRLKVKELRYVLQLSEEGQKQQFVNKLGEVQDAIGEWHDWEELIAIATDVLSHGPQCELVRTLRATSEKKFERALALTNELRRTYVEARRAGRGSRRRGGEQGVSPRVLAATSAISA